MRRWLAGAGCLVLAACAQTPGPDQRAPVGDDPRARIHTELAAQYYSRGQYVIALQELDISLRADEKYAPAYSMLGIVHGELREDAKAEASFKQALSLQPGYSEARNNYGWFLCQRDRYKESLEQFEAAVQNPLYASPELALANAGICSLKQGELKVAENYLERALRRAPNQPMALQHLADLHLHTGRPVTARKMLKQLSAVTQLNAQALWVGVRTERKLADQAAESAYADQLRRRFPDSQEAYWLRTGQFDQPGGRW